MQECALIVLPDVKENGESGIGWFAGGFVRFFPGLRQVLAFLSGAGAGHLFWFRISAPCRRSVGGPRLSTAAAQTLDAGLQQHRSLLDFLPCVAAADAEAQYRCMFRAAGTDRFQDV